MARPVNRIAPLDGLRGIAALIVFVWHSLDVFWPGAIGNVREGAASPPGEDLAAFASVIPVGGVLNGPFAVLLFFSLSGFVLAHVLTTSPRPDTALVLIAQRVLRLFPVAAVGTILAWGLALTGAFRLADLSALNRATLADRYDPALTFSVGTLIKQIGFSIWTGASPPQLYDRVLWTIGAECKGSIVLLALWHVFDRSRRRWVAWVSVVCAGSIVSGEIFVYFAAGAALSDFYGRSTLNAPARSVLWLTLPLAACVAGVHPWLAGYWSPDPFEMVPYGRSAANVSACVVVMSAALYLRPASAILSSAPFRFLGYVSYALYAVHQPLLDSVGAELCLRLAPRIGYDAASIAAMLMTLVASLVLGALIIVAIDVPANALTKQWVRRAFDGQPPAPVAVLQGR